MSTNGIATPTVVRTERGLTIAGTRITLYDVMDYVAAGWPPKLIRDRLNLSDQQIADIMAYIGTHKAEVDAEYQSVLHNAQENRQYWEAHNCERFARSAALPPNPDQKTLRAKLAAWKAKLEPTE